MVLFQVESRSTVVNGSAASGCTHHTPTLLFAKRTIRCPGRAPVARARDRRDPVEPPADAAGTMVNSMDGVRPEPAPQPDNSRQIATEIAST